VITTLRNRSRQVNFKVWLSAAAVLATAYLLGQQASVLWLALLVVAIGGLALFQRPALGILVIVAAALVLPLEIGTGTDVKLNPATLVVPGLLGIWLLGATVRGKIHLAPSRVNRPLILFLVASLVSLMIGNVFWDPFVPRKDGFLLVQFAQWAIFLFSAMAFWLTALLAPDEIRLKRLTIAFLVVGGSMALLRVLPPVYPIFERLTTGAVDRAPFWTLLAALAGGQLLYNRNLGQGTRAVLVVVVGLCLLYVFVLQRESASNWVGVTATGGVLVWLRFPRLRWILIGALLIMALTGLLGSVFYEFAGGDEEWTMSGGSRLALINRVIEVTMRNPITGLGPAAYRPYANVKPLAYGRAFWYDPQINSHNNYVDLFAHGGILGLVLFFWFVVEVVLLGMRLLRRYPDGFAGGYVAAMLGAGAGALAIMALADWILPFVYNIGFQGFQASVLVWLFLGGLVALENMKDEKPIPEESSTALRTREWPEISLPPSGIPPHS
jgi:hypothetical protein